MSRTATGAVLVSCLLALFVGPELGFGPITSTSRADTRRRPVPTATVVVLTPSFIAQPIPPPPANAGTGAPAGGGAVWARLRACESPTNGGKRYRGYYQFSR